jgi:hypothetical protein
LPTFSELATDICASVMLIWFAWIVCVIGLDQLRTLRRPHRHAVHPDHKARPRTGRTTAL